MLADLIGRHANAHGETVQFFQAIKNGVDNLDESEECEEGEEDDERVNTAWAIRIDPKPRKSGTKWALLRSLYYGGEKAKFGRSVVLWVPHEEDACLFGTKEHAGKHMDSWEEWPDVPDGYDTTTIRSTTVEVVNEDEEDESDE